MKTTIQRVTLPDNRRILMLSDVHGHVQGLQSVLQQAAFSPEDVLIIVGDMVEKGPQSLETLRLIRALCQTHTVLPLMGNVDLWRLERLCSTDAARQQELVEYSRQAEKWWGSSFLGELCRDIGAEMDTTAFPQLRRHWAVEFLSHLPTVLETQRMIFVHGGLPHERLDELTDWPAHKLLKWDHFYEDGLSFDKYVAVGHWPVALYGKDHSCVNPIIDHERRILCLDGGCGLKEEGQLNLLVLPCWQSDDFTLYSWTDLPAVIALDAQEERAAAGYIHWGDHQVELLEQDGVHARVLHHGKELRVPASLVHEKNGGYICYDVSGYILPVQPGDELSLVYEFPYGCYVKKNGHSGWYMGRIRKL